MAVCSDVLSRVLSGRTSGGNPTTTLNLTVLFTATSIAMDEDLTLYDPSQDPNLPDPSISEIVTVPDWLLTHPELTFSRDIVLVRLHKRVRLSFSPSFLSLISHTTPL